MKRGARMNAPKGMHNGRISIRRRRTRCALAFAAPGNAYALRVLCALCASAVNSEGALHPHA